MLLRVMERWAFLQLLPEKGNLATMNTVNALRMRLGTTPEEQQELEMIIGVCCVECGNPVENRGTDEEPKYYCIVCDEFVDEVRGVKDQTIWSREKDVGREIDFNRAERRIIVDTFNKLDEKEEVSPIQADLWRKFREAYPEKGDGDKVKEMAEGNDE